MDARHSSAPSSEGGSDGKSAEPASDPSSKPSIIANLFRLASMGRRNGHAAGEEGETDPEALGPSFVFASPAERTMVANILRLRELRVEDVMTPRADIVAVPVDASLDDVMVALSRGSLSRVPVYQETLDDPLGFVHLKDLALIFGVGCVRDQSPFDLRQHLRTALFVPPSMRIVSLLQRMQAERVHMALVIDEFGGVDGLVTIEDLVEQIVGDIEDEHDAEEHDQWRPEGEGVWLVDARADIREFAEAAGVALLPEDWEEEVDTLGGLVFMLTGRVPTRGEVITHPAGHEFEIVDADPRRIRRIRLTVGRAPNGVVAPIAVTLADAEPVPEQQVPVETGEAPLPDPELAPRPAAVDAPAVDPQPGDPQPGDPDPEMSPTLAEPERPSSSARQAAE